MTVDSFPAGTGGRPTADLPAGRPNTVSSALSGPLQYSMGSPDRVITQRQFAKFSYFSVQLMVAITLVSCYDDFRSLGGIAQLGER
ncbi:MAG: hypothetical protein MR671_04145, partial [Clostridiales bacterium]|nr:hypothetical protein [Clostridiales bacterium]